MQHLDLLELLAPASPVFQVIQPYLEWEVPPSVRAYRTLIQEVQSAILSLFEEPDDELEEYSELKAHRIVDALYTLDFDLARELSQEVVQ